MVIFLIWIMLSAVVGAIGSEKKIGFWGGFLISALLSPVIGFIVVLLSDSKIKVVVGDDKRPIQEATKSVADEIEKLKTLRFDGAISEGEYQRAKDKLLSN